MKNAFILSFLIIASALTAMAQQTFSIRGKIVCAQSGSELAFASLHLEEMNGKADLNIVSDSKGNFHLPKVPAGKYTLKVSYVGYETRVLPEVVVQGNIKLGNTELKPLITDLQGVEVVSENKAIDYHPDKQVINISQQLLAKGGNAADALRDIPSIQVDAEGNVSLRGSRDFTLLLDGRPVMMQTAEVLNSIQAENIHQIEVITSPSAKYEAEGSTGIINIITKKEYLHGIDGLLNLSIANGEKYSAGLMLNHQGAKARTYGGISFSDKTKLNESWSERSEDSTTASLNAARKVKMLSAEISLGTDISLSEKTKLSAGLQGGRWEYLRDITSDFRRDGWEEWLKTRERYTNKNDYMQANLNLAHNFNTKDHRFEMDLYYQYLDNTAPDTYTEMRPLYYQYIDASAAKENYRSSIDYQRPINKRLMLECGLFHQQTASAYVYAFSTRSSSSEPWTDNSELSGDMEYEKQNTAAYTSLNFAHKDLEAKVGLRLENDVTKLSTQQDKLQNNNTELFPSLHLSKRIKEKQQLGLSYTKRINQPSEWQLSPLVYSSDRFLRKRGNPALLPENTAAFEVAYNYQESKYSINAQLFHRSIRNRIYGVIENLDETFTETFENLSKAQNSGAELMLSYNPNTWLRLNLGGSCYYAEWEGKLSDNFTLNDQSLVANGNFRSTFLIHPNTSLQFIVMYYAPARTPQTQSEAFYYFDFILRQYLLDKKLSLTLRTHNTFDTGLLKYTVTGEGFTSAERYRYEGPTAIFSLSYKLNNYKLRNTPRPEIDFDSGLDH